MTYVDSVGGPDIHMGLRELDRHGVMFSLPDLIRLVRDEDGNTSSAASRMLARVGTRVALDALLAIYNGRTLDGFSSSQLETNIERLSSQLGVVLDRNPDRSLMVRL